MWTIALVLIFWEKECWDVLSGTDSDALNVVHTRGVMYRLQYLNTRFINFLTDYFIGLCVIKCICYFFGMEMYLG